MKSMPFKPLKILLAVILVLALILVGYIIYLQVNYYRIEDNAPVTVEQDISTKVITAKDYTALSYNIGFGAYDHPFSFFMDTGVMADGTKVRGEYGRARSEEAVVVNTQGVIGVAHQEATDFYLFQEVDSGSDRSYFIDQQAEITGEFDSLTATYAVNFHSAYLFYPFTDPHGRVNSGLLTLSRYNIDSATRRSYPIDESFPAKFFDLDRCFVVNRLPVEGGGELVLINSHMSAYDKGGKSRDAQMKLLNAVLAEEYAKGNWVIVGGDFNNALFGTIDTFPTKQQTPTWLVPIDDSDFADHFHLVEPDNAQTVATERASDIPYERGINHEVVIDGFLVSDNITASAKNIDANFKYSDHNPVRLTFKLNK